MRRINNRIYVEVGGQNSVTSDALGYLVRRLEIAIKRKKLDSCKLNVNEKLFISSNVKTTVCEFIAAE